MSRASILAEVLAERQRQDRVHPETDSLPWGTGDYWPDALVIARERLNMQPTFAAAFLCEVYEALASTAPEFLRDELVQVASLAVRGIERLDREAGR